MLADALPLGHVGSKRVTQSGLACTVELAVTHGVAHWHSTELWSELKRSKHTTVPDETATPRTNARKCNSDEISGCTR